MPALQPDAQSRICLKNICAHLPHLRINSSPWKNPDLAEGKNDPQMTQMSADREPPAAPHSAIGKPPKCA
jgi:hypothetical protein